MAARASRARALVDPVWRRRRWTLPLLALLLVAAGVGLALTQPWLLFVDSEVDTAFDVAVADAQRATRSPDPAPADDPTPADDPDTDDPDADDPNADDPNAVASPADESGEEPAPPTAASTPTGPVLLAVGEFGDRSHPTSGTAAYFALEDGTRVLRFEDLDTDNGPDLFVYLDTDAPDAPAGAFDDGISLGRLQGNIGNQTYEIPADVDLSAYTTVAIWCDRFSVVFGTAALS